MNGVRFGWADCIATVFIALMLFGVTIGARRQTQEFGVIQQCQQNLQQIAQALVMYESVNDGAFPRTLADPQKPLTAFTGADAANPFGPGGPAANDTTAAMFLLAREMELPPDTFSCPAAARHGLAEKDDFDRTTAKQRSNFRARLNDNYSLANMYPDAAATAAGYSLSNFHEKLPATFAIAADTNPGLDDEQHATTQESRIAVRMTNSPNHQRDGQNILFADGSVVFFGSPFGNSSDDIYTADDGGRQPRSKIDAVLLPSWDEGPQATAAIVKDRRWILSGAAVLVIVVLGWIVVRGMHRPSQASA